MAELALALRHRRVAGSPLRTVRGGEHLTVAVYTELRLGQPQEGLLVRRVRVMAIAAFTLQHRLVGGLGLQDRHLLELDVALDTHPQLGAPEKPLLV